MSATPDRQGQRAGISSPGGYSLIELIVAVTIATVIGAGLYFLFTSQQRASRSQKSYNDLQTSCTYAMDTIKGELLLAGYKAKNTFTPISVASPDSITFEFYDDKASTDPPYDDASTFTNHTQVSYSLVDPSPPDPTRTPGKNLVKTIRRWRKILSGPDAPGKYDVALPSVLAEHVQNLQFSYLQEDNNPWPAGGDPAKIRSVRVSLECNAAEFDQLAADPSRGKQSTKVQRLALTAEVRPRNVAIAENPEDKTPPAVPALPQVWDTGQCGCLQLKWASNTDSDIAGYTVYYGLAAGNYIGRARVTHQADAVQRFTLRNLTAANAPYFIALAAHDSSGNQSAISAAVSANPAESVRVEDAGDDTAISPLAPPAPGSPSVATLQDNQLQISWARTYTDCMENPVFGYRIYRSTDPDFTPSGASAGLGTCIADETTLGADATSYLDTGAYLPGNILVGCATYHYKIALVNCDPAQLTNYTDGDPGTATTYTDASFASVSGAPTDGLRPSPQGLSTKAGYRRIILSLTNPSRAEHPDYTFTRVYFSTQGFPTLTETRDAEGYNVVNDPGGGPARLIPDGGGKVIEGGGPHTINFDDEDSEIPNGTPAGIGYPQLNKDETYYFLAVAYDLCKNHSEVTDDAKSAAEQCGDCLPSQGCDNAPPPPIYPHVTQGCNGAPLRLDWDYADSYYSAHPDFQGFRVVRCTGDGCVPLDPALGGSGTILGGTYLSPDRYLVDDSVVDAQTYNYRVYAADCYYQRWLEGLLDGDEIAANDPTNNASSANVSGVALGSFDRAEVTGGDSETFLTADIGPWNSEIPVVSTQGWTHRKLLINSEIIECNGLTSNSFTDCWSRGAEGTIPISHFDGTPVRSYPSAPPREAVTGDLSQVPPDFLHNSVIVGARNTSAGSLTLQALDSSWQTPDFWFERLVYDRTELLFADTQIPLTHGAAGSTVTLQPVQVPAREEDVPLKLTFLKADGTADNTVDLREEELRLTWRYRNDATGIETCSRMWWPPAPEGIVAPPGPTVGGTTQGAPTWGTVAWPVPGAKDNPLNAVVVPSNAWNTVTTNVHDTSGNGIASVRLYYASTDPEVTAAPDVSGAYPGCSPYTMVEMSWWGGETWGASLPNWPVQPNIHNNRNVWYFIVAVDNEGNFDREPEAGQGAFQYFQEPEDPCLNTPRAPELTGSADATSVTLDWSASWFGLPGTYYNTNWTPCNDLGGFRVYHRRGSGAWSEVAGSPFPKTTKTYTQNFSVQTTSLTWQVPATLASPLALSVTDPSDFRVPGKVKVDAEIFLCMGKDAWHLTGCSRAQDGSPAADHALGALVTQDLLALETNSYYVSAFDTCSTGALHSESAIFTEGLCTPVCQQWTWPSGSPIQPGDSFSVSLQACQKAGNGAQDRIYLHTCSSVEGDDVELVEDPTDNGYFSASLGTQLGSAPDGVQNVLMVSANDTILVGGYASAPGSWGDVNACFGKTYSCGGAQQVVVATRPPDPCATDHYPPSITAAPVSSLVVAPDRFGVPKQDTCTGTLNRQMLTWNSVAFPAACTATRYTVYYSQYVTTGKEGSWTTYAPANFASNPVCGGGTCTSELNPTPTKINGNQYRFAVTAVCELDTCQQWDGSTYTRTWESPSMSPDTGDACE